MLWSVQVGYAVTVLIVDYYRKSYAADSRSYMEDIGNGFYIDWRFNEMNEFVFGTILRSSKNYREKYYAK